MDCQYRTGLIFSLVQLMNPKNIYASPLTNMI